MSVRRQLLATTQLRPPMISGRYYPALEATAGLGTSAAAQSRLRIGPFFARQPGSWDRIGSNVTVAVAATTLRWVVYADSSGYPGALLLDTGAVGDSSTTGWKEATISLTTPVGWYWIGLVAQGGAPTLTTHQGQLVAGTSVTSAEIIANSGNASGYFLDAVTAAAPNPFTAGSTMGGIVPAVWLRRV